MVVPSNMLPNLGHCRCSSDWALKWLDLNQTECGIVVGGGKCWCEYNCRHCVIVQSSPENQQYGVEVTTCWNFVWTIQADIVTTTQPNTKEWLFKFWVLSQSASLIFVFTVICSAYYGVAETQSAADYMSLWWVSWASWGALELVCTTVHKHILFKLTHTVEHRESDCLCFEYCCYLIKKDGATQLEIDKINFRWHITP